MSAAQCKAARRRLLNDPRYKPKKGLRGGATSGARRAEARNRKRLAAGQLAGSIGYSKKK